MDLWHRYHKLLEILCYPRLMSLTPSPTHPPSILDVARLAGVSAQTVSRVARHAPNVKETTRTRVLHAMDQLGYTPNRAARALRQGSYSALGVITQNLARTGEHLITAGIASRAEELGYSVNLAQVSRPQPDTLTRAGSHLSNQAIDGLIIVQAGSAKSGALSIPRALPCVVSDSRFIDDYSSVTADQARSTREAINHLLALGHRNIAHVGGPVDSRSAMTRERTWRRTLAESGLDAGPLYQGDWSGKSGYEAGTIIARDSRISAVFCANDEMAFGVLRALAQAGRRVPEDVSVIGFDNIELSEYSTPALTTVDQDFSAIGRALVDLLIDNIESGTRNLEHRIIDSHLVIRHSTGPCATWSTPLS